MRGVNVPMVNETLWQTEKQPLQIALRAAVTADLSLSSESAGDRTAGTLSASLSTRFFSDVTLDPAR
jgi:hypothetical protein